jgi:hypothetical protein
LVEVDEETKRQAREAEVGEDLGFVHGQQVLDRLDLDKNLAINNHVESKPPLDCCTLVDNREGPLPLDVMAALDQLALQTFLVRGFQQSGSERLVHLNGSPNDSSRNPVQSHLCALLPLCALGSGHLGSLSIQKPVL